MTVTAVRKPTFRYPPNELAALDCLRFVRKESGKVREYELRSILAKHQEEVEGIKPPIWSWINALLDFSCLIRDEAASSDEGDDRDGGELDVVYTDPSNRLVIDLLLADAFPDDVDSRFNIATFSTAVKVEAGSVGQIDERQLHFSYPEIDSREMGLRERAARLLEEQAREASGKPLTVRTVAWLAEKVKDASIDWSHDLRDIFIKDFNYRYLTELVGHAVVLKDFCGEQSFFAGKTDLSGAVFMGNVDFAGAVFETSHIDLADAHFDLDGRGSVTFRNSRIFRGDDQSGISLDRAVFSNPGPRAELSFEDAVIDAPHMSFSKVDLRGVQVYLFQAVARHCTARFVECRIDRHMDFDDSVFKRVLLLGMDELTSLRFTFRTKNPVERLVIENCIVRDRIDIDSVDYLSLKGSTVDGHIRTPWKKRGRPNFGVIEAISANSDSPEEKSQQFLALKQNFAALGQYDHEDRAFSSFMSQRQTPATTHFILDVLRRIGDYGASPGRLLATILSVWAIFATAYATWSVLQPGAFSFGGAFSLHTVLASALLSASRLMNLGADVTPTAWMSNAICVTQGTVGWFLLAMFSVAIVRKTVR